ncbi:YHYH domain-containing protein [Methylomonas sp. MS20]|uniref:YHYH domain-containing protein n=1 Tax=Methylomonas sp. MS20 TaxID=3418769 RepID=UPI003D004F16
MIALILAVHYQGAAHPGKVDTEGCHTNLKTGQYYCHSSQAAQSPRSNAKAFKSYQQRYLLQKHPASAILIFRTNSEGYERYCT